MAKISQESSKLHARIVKQIGQILERDEDWSADTLIEISNLFRNAGLTISRGDGLFHFDEVAAEVTEVEI